MWPKYEGRWSICSGVKYSFDPHQPPGARIILDTLRNDHDEPIEMEKKYTVATNPFLFSGKDGYSAFLDPSVEQLPPYINEAIGI